MNTHKHKQKKQVRRRNHVRRIVRGTADRPRLSVFRSSKHIYAQLINDEAGADGSVYGGNIQAAELVGTALAKVAVEKGILLVCFDRGHYRYHGRIKALADAARAGGLKF